MRNRRRSGEDVAAASRAHCAARPYFPVNVNTSWNNIWKAVCGSFAFISHVSRYGNSNACEIMSSSHVDTVTQTALFEELNGSEGERSLSKNDDADLAELADEIERRSA